MAPTLFQGTAPALYDRPFRADGAGEGHAVVERAADGRDASSSRAGIRIDTACREDFGRAGGGT
jgi:hypothetical protein